MFGLENSLFIWEDMNYQPNPSWNPGSAISVVEAKKVEELPNWWSHDCWWKFTCVSGAMQKNVLKWIFWRCMEHSQHFLNLQSLSINGRNYRWAYIDSVKFSIIQSNITLINYFDLLQVWLNHTCRYGCREYHCKWSCS